MKLALWFKETRPPFLLLSVILVILGTSVAVYDGFFNPLYFIVTIAGLVLAHISVNVLNDYFDYKTGIDLETKRTPFSGGSGLLAEGLLSPPSTMKFGLACFLLAIPLALYLLITVGWLLLPTLLLGGLFILLYTPHLARLMLGEISAGLGLGALPIIGSYFVQAGVYTPAAMVASVPSMILTFNLLFLNEFPDLEPDRRGGRRNLVIALGREKAGRLYTLLTVSMYMWIVGSVLAGLMPPPVLMTLLTIPFALKAGRGALRDYSEQEKFISALGANVVVVLGTQALLAVGYLVALYL